MERTVPENVNLLEAVQSEINHARTNIYIGPYGSVLFYHCREKIMKRVLLLLCKGVEIYEAAAFYDVLGWAGAYGTETVEAVTVGLQKNVRGAFGIQVIPDKLISEVKIEGFEALAIPGGFEAHGYYEEAYSEPVADLIRHFNELKKPIASICVGALPLANSGILKGRQATTYHLREGIRRKQLTSFGVDVVDKPIVWDKNIVTSTSPATAMDVAFELLARITSEANADQLRQLMGFEQ
jgi:protein deglycase